MEKIRYSEIELYSIVSEQARREIYGGTNPEIPLAEMRLEGTMRNYNEEGKQDGNTDSGGESSTI